MLFSSSFNLGLPTPQHCGLQRRDQPHGLHLQHGRHLLRLGQLDQRSRQLRSDQRAAGGELHRVASQGRCCHSCCSCCSCHPCRACHPSGSRSARSASSSLTFQLMLHLTWPESMEISRQSNNNNFNEAMASLFADCLGVNLSTTMAKTRKLKPLVRDFAT